MSTKLFCCDMGGMQGLKLIPKLVKVRFITFSIPVWTKFQSGVLKWRRLLILLNPVANHSCVIRHCNELIFKIVQNH